MTTAPDPSSSGSGGDGTLLEDRAVGSLVCAAVGDAVGGATEGFSPQQIRERWGDWVTGVVDSYWGENWRTARPTSPFHKGDGHFTDDTLMTHLLVEVYDELGRHLDAFDIAASLVPRLLTQQIYIPEIEGEGVALNRLFLAEKYLALRLEYGNVDPREAGVGNIVNCGAAMYISPVGIVNAGDPERAYAEAIDIAGAHQSSYGREAAGVLAAAVAAAASPAAALDDVNEVAVGLAHDGTRDAIGAVLDEARRWSSWREAIDAGALRDAFRPFDTLGEAYRAPGLGARRPSRIHSIEELPIALGMLTISRGDAREAILGGTNYGRDSDSIASMAGAIAGALGGRAAIPADLADEVATASRTDLAAPAVSLAAVAKRVRQADAERASRVARRAEQLLSRLS